MKDVMSSSYIDSFDIGVHALPLTMRRLVVTGTATPDALAVEVAGVRRVHPFSNGARLDGNNVLVRGQENGEEGGIRTRPLVDQAVGVDGGLLEGLGAENGM